MWISLARLCSSIPDGIHIGAEDGSTLIRISENAAEFLCPRKPGQVGMDALNVDNGIDRQRPADICRF